MTKITYIEPDGERIEAEGENGSTVMETAILNGVPGIVAECGGACSCATCHVYVDDAWTDVVGGPSPMEEDMLDFAFEVKPTSRLSCQIKVRDEIDGWWFGCRAGRGSSGQRNVAAALSHGMLCRSNRARSAGRSTRRAANEI